MRKPTDSKEETPSFFDKEIQKTQEIIGKSALPKTETNTSTTTSHPTTTRSLEDWKAILGRNTLQRKKKDGTVFQEGFQITTLLTKEGDFEILVQIQKYAESNCGGNMTLALMQLCKKGLNK